MSHHRNASGYGNVSHRGGSWGAGENLIGTEIFSLPPAMSLDQFPSPPTPPPQVYNDFDELDDVQGAHCDAFTDVTSGPPLIHGQSSSFPAGAPQNSTSSSSRLSTLSSQLFEDRFPQHRGPDQAQPLPIILEPPQCDLRAPVAGDPPLRSNPTYAWDDSDNHRLQTALLAGTLSEQSSRHVSAASSSGSSGRVQCPYCDTSLKNREGYSHHRRRLHNPNALKTYQCNICSRRWSHPKELERHKKTHSTRRSFRCTFPTNNRSADGACAQELKRRDNTRRHVMKAHGVIKENVDNYIELIGPEPIPEW